jgi:hypothetical protein
MHYSLGEYEANGFHSRLIIHLLPEGILAKVRQAFGGA